ncbi:class I SAM-dependent methyltransferase [candidate division WOR-3 bacterium]|nr:class I SAM-dependent methyltransferase [candidate division WOR-3 bacterium]
MFYDIYNSRYYNSVREFIEIPKVLMSKPHASVSVCNDDYLAINDSVSKILSGGNWLDVGGGIGSFLYYIRNHNEGFKLYLSESNERSAEFAERQFGIEVLKPDIFDENKTGLRFNVLSLLSVIEHISEPIDFLEKCVRIIQPRGLMVINTPRYSLLNRLLSKEASYNVIPPYHVSLFNEKNLVRPLVERFGLKLKNIWFSGQNAFSFIDIMHLSEFCDVKIPEKNDENLMTLCELNLRPQKRLVYGILRRLDKNFEKIIKVTDGKNMINAVFEKI